MDNETTEPLKDAIAEEQEEIKETPKETLEPVKSNFDKFVDNAENEDDTDFEIYDEVLNIEW